LKEASAVSEQAGIFGSVDFGSNWKLKLTSVQDRRTCTGANRALLSTVLPGRRLHGHAARLAVLHRSC